MKSPQPPYLFGLVGKKLGHSFSRGYFTKKFAEMGLEAEYRNFELEDIRALPEVLVAHPNLLGLNVTIPYKEAFEVFTATGADIFSPIPAANTLVVREGKIVSLHNTDIVGFRQSLENGWKTGTGKALILGTGGAAKAVAAALGQMERISEIHFATRNPSQANQHSYASLKTSGLASFALIVNTTPLGMFPDVETAPELAYETLQPHQHLFDLVYNPAETRFMELGRSAGCTVQNGLEMLELQAEAAWKIWTEAAGLR